MDKLTVIEKIGLLQDAIEIRKEVFMEEQGFIDEFDEIDKEAICLVLYNHDEAVATSRSYIKDGIHYIGRVAVKSKYRSNNYGAKIMKETIDMIRKRGGQMIKLSAQIQAQNFYEKCGFKKIGEPYMDEHCLHIEMIKDLSQ